MLRTALLGAALAGLAAADMTVIVATDVPPLPLQTQSAVLSAGDLWAQSLPEERPPQTPYNASLLLSKYTPEFDVADTRAFAPNTIYPSSDSVVRGALEAWAQHQHLVLRPDEVWFEVLAQLNFYMAAHAEEVRHLFVDFDGQEEIVVKAFTWRDVISSFAGEIQKRVKTDWLKEWIMPGFSTSNEDDGMTATVLMMGLVKQYFSFTGGIICGLPQVTLLGTRDDWARLVEKLDRLSEFGEEPQEYAENLRPIFNRFVRTFDEPDSEEIKTFWRQIVRAEHHMTCGKGAIEFNITGWILGLLYWNENGGLRVPKPSPDGQHYYVQGSGGVTLDGVEYHGHPMDKLPVGYARVPLKMLDFPQPGTDSDAYLVAGNIGVNRTAAVEEGGYARAQPMSSWFMFGPVDKSHNQTGALGSFKELNAMAMGMEEQPSCPGYQKPWDPATSQQ
ncbi:hypothetical protein ISF_06839 [Cordyceps fumosorosea ARSEF 2679]|uniref:DUF4419 domain-containing protein n=1 Tax=Cordyceps fumosorosea (strain ARSEF 2679) TaxID=1081104 RepID=A0A167R5Z3_CORFA|nr:hypothetical protein ISF_06839 [Cordyceps fumosorosea ARSEF 2679]OAA58300.1 hypothetical protein ISF_06839 [Cordyceps fumosorosea ARSEF 2679]